MGVRGGNWYIYCDYPKNLLQFQVIIYLNSGDKKLHFHIWDAQFPSRTHLYIGTDLKSLSFWWDDPWYLLGFDQDSSSIPSTKLMTLGTGDQEGFITLENRLVKI